VRRVGESQSVLGALGVSETDVHFIGLAMGISDGQLLLNLDLAFQALEPVVRPLQRVSDVYAPALEGGHQDHDVVHLIALCVSSLVPVTGAVWQFSLYNGRGLPGPLFRVMSPLKENGVETRSPIPWRDRVRYLKLCLGYPSQWRTWVGLFPFVFVKIALFGRYVLQKADISRLAQRPHPGSLLYERRGGGAWEEFRQVAARFMKALSSSE